MIRLQRVGKKNEPTFRVVLTDSKNGPKSGKFLEILGSYDARDKNESKVNADRVKELIANGAQLSDTVHNFLINQEIIKGNKINALPKKTPIKKEGEEVVKETPTVTEEAPKAETKTSEEPTTEEKPIEEVKKETPAPEEKIEEAPKEEVPTESEEKKAE